MKLHEAIIRVLEEYGKAMTVSEIAAAINENKWYERKDKRPVPSSQISARINRETYRHLFSINNEVSPIKINISNK